MRLKGWAGLSPVGTACQDKESHFNSQGKGSQWKVLRLGVIFVSKRTSKTRKLKQLKKILHP